MIGVKRLYNNTLRFVATLTLILLCGVSFHTSAQDGNPPPRDEVSGGNGAGGGGRAMSTSATSARARRSAKSVIRNGVLVVEEPVVDTLAQDSIARDTMARVAAVGESKPAAVGTEDGKRKRGERPERGKGEHSHADSTHHNLQSQSQGAALLGSASVSTAEVAKAPRKRYFTDSMSLSKVAWTSAFLPGFGQVYNDQKWKLPILYGALAGGIALYVKENKRYQPLKKEYEELTMESSLRTVYMNDLQKSMIRSNTRRQIYMGATFATYIYSIGDAAVNYKTNDVSSVKRATTLATICPGAGQIYNKSYWKVPFVVGGFAAMIYVVDWNNRGYKRFDKAYTLVSEYDADPDQETNYPNGSLDEFNGRYTADYMKSLRDSYRRNRDLSIIMMAGLYILQIVDAHVDAHFKDFDVSDDLSMNIEPMVGYNYSPTVQRNCATFGFNVGVTF